MGGQDLVEGGQADLVIGRPTDRGHGHNRVDEVGHPGPQLGRDLAVQLDDETDVHGRTAHLRACQLTVEGKHRLVGTRNKKKINK